MKNFRLELLFLDVNSVVKELEVHSALSIKLFTEVVNKDAPFKKNFNKREQIASEVLDY